MAVGWHLVVILAGVLASAFFSGVETGLISLNRVRLRNEVERKNRRAIVLSTFVENTEKLLGTTLVGNNLANVMVAVSMSTLAAHLFGASTLVGLAATVTASALLLVFGEITPKTLFRHYPHRLCMSVADVLNALAWLFAPVVFLLGMLMHGIARMGRDAEQPKSFFVTREELKHLAKEGEAGGALSSEERQMIDGVFDFPYKTVQEVMVPLSRAVTVTPEAAIGDVYIVSQQSGYARLPVREADKIVGVVNVYEALFENAAHDHPAARDLMQAPQYVRSTDRINRVLPVLRAGRNPLSIVLGPEGRPIGIITIEDIVEEIVGDIEG